MRPGVPSGCGWCLPSVRARFAMLRIAPCGADVHCECSRVSTYQNLHRLCNEVLLAFPFCIRRNGKLMCGCYSVSPHELSAVSSLMLLKLFALLQFLCPSPFFPDSTSSYDRGILEDGFFSSRLLFFLPHLLEDDHVFFPSLFPSLALQLC